MKKYSEKELFAQNNFNIFRLKNMYKNDTDAFNNLLDYINCPIFINDRNTFDYTYFSKVFFSYGSEMEELYKKGFSFLHEISEPFLLNMAKKNALQFSTANDYNSVISNLLCVSLNHKMTHFFTTKCLLNDALTLNFTVFPEKQSMVAKLLNTLLPESHVCLQFWQQFQSLTKQEKIVLKLMSKGKNSNEIGEKLHISRHTVASHRKNIYNKTKTNSLTDLVRFSMLLDLVD